MVAAMEKLTNPVKERMAAGEAVLGLNVRMARSADLAHIAKGTGHDFIFIDTQHSLFNLETVGHVAQAAWDRHRADGIARSVYDPDVRSPRQRRTGIIFPDVTRRRKRASSTPPNLRRSASVRYAAAFRISTTAVPLYEAIPR